MRQLLCTLAYLSLPFLLVSTPPSPVTVAVAEVVVAITSYNMFNEQYVTIVT